MPTKIKPYEQFGPFLLFKKLESDALGELWRAARLDATGMGPLLALRRLAGGNRAAFVSGVSSASTFLPALAGTTVVKDQHVGIVAGVPYLSWEYAGGRSLRHIVDRARGAGGVPANPLPTDQAVAIAERVASSLEATFGLKQGTTRLTHGALVPQFVWITDDGDVRVGGQGLVRALSVSLDLPEFAKEFGVWLAPEIQQSGTPTPGSEVFALGALLWLMLTGEDPPDAAGSSDFLERGRLMAGGAPLPNDLRVVLQRSLNKDPVARYPSAAEMRGALSALVHGGPYSATTFNLAFYLSHLLKKEIEGEAIEHEREMKVPISLYQEGGAPATSGPIPVAAATRHAPAAARAAERSKLPLIAALVVVVLLGAGGWLAWGRRTKTQAPPAAAAATKTASPLEQLGADPIVAANRSTATTPASPSEEEKRKAFEEAVRRGLREEMLKLQAEENRRVQTAAARTEAPSTSPARAAPQPEEVDAPSAASLDQARREQQQPPLTATVPAQTTTTVPSSAGATVPLPGAATTTTAASSPQPLPSEPPAPARVVQEGDLIDILNVDQAPRRVSEVAPVYPPMALRIKASATIILSALVSESGSVTEVKVLRGDARGLGLNEAAIRAIRQARFTPAIKDGNASARGVPVPVSFNAK